MDSRELFVLLRLEDFAVEFEYFIVSLKHNQYRPNFILFITDQHRADYLGCYGHPVLRTPHIDRIARNGVRFDKFYVSSPQCQSNRSTMMTGRMQSVHGVRGAGIPLPLRSNTFVDLMRANGYETALVGKCHLQNIHDWTPESADSLHSASPPADPSLEVCLLIESLSVWKKCEWTTRSVVPVQA